ncbi:hypothetical protein FDECE_17124 [Fusarium decemcellulare]|nr:hypothetical protein FDECE_17124 [Fusarium decemcellulare]
MTQQKARREPVSSRRASAKQPETARSWERDRENHEIIKVRLTSIRRGSSLELDGTSPGPGEGSFWDSSGLASDLATSSMPAVRGLASPAEFSALTNAIQA